MSKLYDRSTKRSFNAHLSYFCQLLLYFLPYKTDICLLICLLPADSLKSGSVIQQGKLGEKTYRMCQSQRVCFKCLRAFGMPVQAKISPQICNVTTDAPETGSKIRLQLTNNEEIFMSTSLYVTERAAVCNWHSGISLTWGHCSLERVASCSRQRSRNDCSDWGVLRGLVKC